MGVQVNRLKYDRTTCSKGWNLFLQLHITIFTFNTLFSFFFKIKELDAKSHFFFIFSALPKMYLIFITVIY